MIRSKLLRLLAVCLQLQLVLVPATQAATALNSKNSNPTHSIIRYDSIHHPVMARAGMVVSQRELASQVGAEILQQGGNAVDAAVAVGFALAVVLPRAGNLGGGGFMMLHLAEENKTLAIDYRETAPQAAHQDIFVNADGSVDKNAHRTSHRSAGVPGTVAGLNYALQRYGSLPLATVIEPAIRLAADGFVLDYDTASAIATRKTLLSKYPATKAIFFHSDGSLRQAGEVFKQADLAKTLQRIADGGADAFYKGAIAQQIVAESERHNGLMTMADLANYKAVERQPIWGSYRGHKVASMPPPSSGGIHIVQMLNILENFPVAEMGLNTSASIHLLSETMKRAYADRSKHLGDPDFYPVPMQWLASKSYAKKLAAAIDLKQLTPSSEIEPGVEVLPESENTTHYSVMDAAGNAVSNTYTLNYSFGAGIVVEGAGFLLNNEMADFSAKAGVPYAFGLLGGKANSIEALKRPLSAMTPTFVFKDDAPYLVTGSPGGSRIINTVLQQIVNVVDHGMNLASATHAPRVHHQWFPDQLEVEAAHNPDTLQRLQQLGHKPVTTGTMGSLQSIMNKDGLFMGVADPRRPGAAAIGVE